MKSLRTLGLMFGLTVILIGCSGGTISDENKEPVKIDSQVQSNGDVCYYFYGWPDSLDCVSQ